MDKSTFDAAQPYLDQIADILDKASDLTELSRLRQAMVGLSKILGERYLVELNVTLEVVDPDKAAFLPLLTTGLVASKGEEPYWASGDLSPHRYIVDGELHVVPHDRCPKCWDVWDFKWENRSCPNCDAVMGQNCKILLDTDICPHCEKGRVSMQAPSCDQCGITIEPHLVVWGRFNSS